MNEAAILVIGPSWVGDMVMSHALFQLLRSRYPESPIDVVAPDWSLPLLARMPEIRSGIALPLAHGELGLRRRFEIGRELGAAGYAQAIVLPRSLKAALLPWFARVPRRTGFRGEMRFGLINDMRALDRTVLDQTGKRFLALGVARDEPLPDMPQPNLEVSRDNQQRLIASLQLQTDKPVIALLPGAEYGPAKCWPLDYFRDLAAMLGQAGFAVWVLGSVAEHAAGEHIAANGAARNLCGETALADAIDLLAYCRQAVSNDSGLMHVAAAAGIHVNAIYGSSTPLYTPPLTARSNIHYLGLECSPCFERQCPLGHLRCLREIRPETVFAGIRQVRPLN